ncbi:MAG: S53 family peptidase, partial [Acidimicrobiia bacterium]|nr:S53 family peptidase [Acidimicrobiia bacterium]
EPHAGSPAYIQQAYDLTWLAQNRGAGDTVAVVDAYDDPNAESDLAVYRAQYGLPACHSNALGTGCFRKFNQLGVQGLYPGADSGWSEEISLDLDMVSAICPNCGITLVEANSPTYDNLGQAVFSVDETATTEISNSYGGGEFSGENAYDHYYTHAGIPITVSSGDHGFGVEYPAASPGVTAVGGTSLSRATNARGWTEAAWSGAGSGCSGAESRPGFQASTNTGCSRRAVADVSAVADPSTGVAVYDTYGVSGWLVFGGTSVASPIIASVYALAGNGASIAVGYPYSHTTSLFDITSGNNGRCRRTPQQLCTAGPGWDGPTGWGTPNGTGAF